MRWLAALVLVAGCNFRVGGLPIAGPDGGGDDAGAPDFAVPTPGSLGDACSSALDCASGNCVDGVCCDTACDPGSTFCMACNVPGSEGHCVFAAAGSDPQQQCDADPVDSCGRDGLCDGMGGCGSTSTAPRAARRRAAAARSPTRPPATAPATASPAADVVRALQLRPSSACATTCTSPANGCAPPAVCNNGSCGKRAAGQPCTQPSDCQSNVLRAGRLLRQRLQRRPLSVVQAPGASSAPARPVARGHAMRTRRLHGRLARLAREPATAPAPASRRP